MIPSASLARYLRRMAHRLAARPKGLDRSPDPSLRCASRGARLLRGRRLLAPRSPRAPGSGCAASRLRREAGVTLVELLIAVALLGFILLGIAPLFIGSVKSNYSANEYTSIHNLARDRLEQLMTLPFTDAQLAPGLHSVSDLPPTLPDPRTGVPPPPGPGAVPNPFELTYEVQQFSVADEAAVATGAPFLPTPVAAAGAQFHYKRIDVTVRTRSGNMLGIGNRVSRVSGIVSNPTQTGPQQILSVAPIPTPTP